MAIVRGIKFPTRMILAFWQPGKERDGQYNDPKNEKSIFKVVDKRYIDKLKQVSLNTTKGRLEVYNSWLAAKKPGKPIDAWVNTIIDKNGKRKFFIMKREHWSFVEKSVNLEEEVDSEPQLKLV